MKKIILILILLRPLSGYVCNAQEKTWQGTFRFNIADNLINLHNALPGLYITWTPYILPCLGIPAELDINFGWGALSGVETSLLSGAEYIPIGPAKKEKNGLFLDAKIGVSLFVHEGAKLFFVSKSNIGYQIITKKAFVFTPGIGVVYNGRSGFGLNIMLDLGFAYKVKKMKKT